MALSQSDYLLIEEIWGDEGVVIKESDKDGIRRGGLFILSVCVS